KSADARVGFGEETNAFFALRAPVVIGAGGQIVFDHGVADYEFNTSGNVSKLKVQRSAVKKQSVSCPSHAGDKLIHDTNPGADVFVFCLAADFGDFWKRKSFAVETDEGESGSHFDGSRGTQPRADGHISMHQQIRSLQITPMLAQDECDAQHIVPPRTGALGRQTIDIEFEISGKLVGLNQQLAVL